MAYFVFGGSNSIFRDGWIAAFAQRVDEPVLNRSVGATTTLAGLFRFLASGGESTPQPGDCVVWEYALNEVNHVQRGYARNMLRRNVEHLMILCRQRGCRFLPLIMTPQSEEMAKKRDRYYAMLADLFAAYGIAAFDISQAWRQQAGAAHMPKTLYEENAHYAREPELMGFIGDNMARLAGSAGIPADIAPRHTGGAELGLADLSYDGMHKNSLMELQIATLPQRIEFSGHGRIAAICALCRGDVERGIMGQLVSPQEEPRQMRLSVTVAKESRTILKAVSLENATGRRWRERWRFGPGDVLELSGAEGAGAFYAEYTLRRNLRAANPDEPIRISGVLLEYASPEQGGLARLGRLWGAHHGGGK